MQQLKSEILSHYFAGQDAGDAGSNYLGMCAAALAGGRESVKCRACSGNGFRELSANELRKWSTRIAQASDERRPQLRRDLSRESDCAACCGTGKATARRADRSAAIDSMWTTVQCGSCRGSGEVVNPTDASAERGDVCLACGGEAYIVPVTVRCGKHHEQGGGSGGVDTSAPLMLPAAEPVDEGDEQEGRLCVAAEIEALRARDPQLAAALASYHGPEGDRWVGHRWGRGFAVWQHTQAGSQLAEHVAAQSIRGCGYLVDAVERLAHAREAQERPFTGRPPADHQLRRSLVTRADQEARALLHRVLAFGTSHEKAA